MKRQRPSSPAVAAFEKQLAESEEAYLQNRERYDTYLQLLKQADTWEELARIITTQIPERLDIDLEDCREWLDDNLFSAFHVLESDIKHAAASIAVQSSPYYRHQLECRMHICTIALRKLREILKTAPTKETSDAPSTVNEIS